MVTALVGIALAPAPAGAAGTDSWSASGPGTVNLLSDGASSNPSFSYYYCPVAGVTEGQPCQDSGATTTQTWTFQATASANETVTAPYLWTGNHAWFEAFAELQPFTEEAGKVTPLTPIVDDGPCDVDITPGCSPYGPFQFSGTYSFGDLSAGETYGFYISGSNDDYNSFLYGTFTFATVTTPPAAPTTLMANPGNGSVNLSWAEPASEGQATSYNVFEGTSPGDEGSSPVTTVTSTAATVTGLTNGTTYYFTVAASNSFTSSSPSSEVSATPEAFADNTSWFTAQPISLTDPSGASTGTTTQSIDLPGETLWYEFPVLPDEQVQVSLTNVPADYDISLFSDISQAFQEETSSTPSLLALGAEAPGSAAAPSAFSPSAFSPSAFSPSAFSPSAFSPSAFSPSAFSPSAFSPSAFSPSAFSPSAFSPSAFSPSAFSPSAFSPSAFSADYAEAQVASLLAVSTASGPIDKSVTAETWNNTGNFYIRISGNNGAFDPSEPFTLTVTTSGSACSVGINSNPGNLSDLYQSTTGGTLSGTGTSYQTMIVDNSSLMPAVGQAYTGADALYTPLQQLAAATDGSVLDVGQSVWVNDLVAQAEANPSCPYAENLEAGAIQQIINTYRTSTSTLRYVVIVGDDDVIPFFRYPDNAGLAPESDYEPPLSSESAADAALQEDDYLSDDQYGAVQDLSIQGATVPLATAAVGRLVETPSDIYNTVESYLSGHRVIDPSSSLVTGYDFMQPPASEVASAFASGLGTNPTELITNDGVPASSTGSPPAQSWTASQLSADLSGNHHYDLVFLGAHFSANNLLAADDSSTITTNQFATEVGGSLEGSLVISPGCHSGYGIDPADAIPGVTDTLAWPQAFTEAGATLIAGTGYQYGDTNYVAYSDQLYVDLAKQLGDQPASGPGPVPVGAALAAAKLQYLAGLDQLNGLEEKSLLQVTLYGLPMLAIEEPHQVPAGPGQSSAISASPAATGPGNVLGLEEANFDLQPSLTPESAPAPNSSYTYDSGPQGEVADPGSPVLPLEIEDVNVAGETLRGVGFWGGSYSDTAGTTPLTGDPATDTGNTNLVQFSSPAFFPQTLWNPNYFPTLVNGGDTELATTPVQYESDSATTDVMRTYSNLDLHLFYSNNTASYTGTAPDGSTFSNVPALAAPPTISDVTSSVSGDQVTVTAQVTGDPAAGIQEVWLTFTGSASGPLYGSWQSVDLVQSSGDSSLWTGTITDANGNATGDPASDLRFIVQAVNGVGEVSMDNNDGYYFTPGSTPGAALPSSANTYSLSLGGATTGSYQASASVSATLTATGGASANPAAKTVTFTLGATTVTALTDTDGVATATLPLVEPPGTYTLSASYGGGADDQPAATSEQFEVTAAPTQLELSVPSGDIVSGQPSGITATLSANAGTAVVPLPQEPVYFVISGPSGTVFTATAITNANGIADAGALDVPAANTGVSSNGDVITAYFGGSVPLPGGGSYEASETGYAPSESAPASINVTAPISTLLLGPGAGALRMSGQSALSINGTLAVNSSSDGAVKLSGQSALGATGALVSPSAQPIVSSGQARTSFTSVENIGPETDPYADLAAPPITGMSVYTSSSMEGPGIYTKTVTVGGQSDVTLQSGIYIFEAGLNLSGNATLSSGNGGVVLYFAGGGLTISGQARAVLSAIGSGPYQGVSLFEARNDSTPLVLSGQGCTTLFAGAIYAPNATVEASGTTQLAAAALVADSASLTGQSKLAVGT